MKLLTRESPLLILPDLAVRIGLNEAIILQQVHFRSKNAQNLREGHRWVHKTYGEWQKQDFPFWSVDTIKRVIRKLEKQGFLVSTDIYNRMKIDKTKWYRIDYAVFYAAIGQNAFVVNEEIALEDEVNAPSSEGGLPPTITKELKTTVKEYKTRECFDVVSIVDYLNEKARKQYKSSSPATVRLIQARYGEGYNLNDFKKVIDTKVKDWLDEPRWEKYLRPSTLFSATNFENYLEESKHKQVSHSQQFKPFTLDFNRGECCDD